ncbi:MAG: SapC family protein [Rhodobacteraceae bacterium]|nr:SapC family protein [Paracoccaceae bacterium]
MPVTDPGLNGQGWCWPDSFAFAHRFHMLPVFADEHEAIAANLPVVFDDSAMPWAVLRLARGGPSAMIAMNGVWRGSHVPKALCTYPFALGPQGDDAALWVDADSRLIRPAPQGQPFLGPDGQLTPALAQLQSRLAKRAQTLPRMQTAAHAILQSGLLQPFPQESALAGYFTLSRARLAGLGRAEIARLHRSGALALALAHFVSLAHVALMARAEQDLATPSSRAGSAQGQDRLAEFLTAVQSDRTAPDVTY